MIDVSYVQVMARYNRWQNRSIFGAADTLDDAARRKDCGAFWGSIHGTLSHLMWGDMIWMHRFDGWDKPPVPFQEAITMHETWQAFAEARGVFDEKLIAWAADMDPTFLQGGLQFYSGVLDREVSRPTAPCVVHFFNHQTHHRGQVHALLTAAGAKPDDTDLFLMPQDV